MIVVAGYMQFAEQMFIKFYKFSPESAGSLIPIPFLMYSIISPFNGIIIDKLGSRCTMSIVGSVILIISQAWVCFFPHCDKCNLSLAPLFLQGIANTITYSLQFGSIIAYTVEPHMLGTAYGIIFSCNNISSVVFPLVLGKIEVAAGF